LLKRSAKIGNKPSRVPEKNGHELIRGDAGSVGMDRPAYPLILGPSGPSSAGLCVSYILAYVVKRSN
jgi:hypothetical protein